MSIALNSDNSIRITDIEAAFQEQTIDSVDQVRARLLDLDQTEIASWITLSETSGESGVWLGTFSDDDVDVEADTRYPVEAEVMATIDGEQRKRTKQKVVWASRS